jgi:xylulokinase
MLYDYDFIVRRNLTGQLLLGLDLGTTLIKAVIFDTNGRIIASSEREVEVIYPKPGWAEQDPEVLWNTTVLVIKEVLERCKDRISEIAALSLTGQMHGTFLLDKEGKLARKQAIIWLDSRSKDIVEKFYRDGLSEVIYDISGWRLIPSMQLAHLCWLKDHEPETLKNTKAFLTCKDYIRYKLTNIPLTDYTDASVSGLMDIRAGKWSNEIIELIGVPSDIFPEIRGSWEYAGSVTAEVAKLTGLKEGVPVAVGAGDICSTALGAGALDHGQLTAIIGTAGIYELTVKDLILDDERRYSVAYAAIPGSWLLEAVQMVAGAALRWFRDEFCNEEKMRAKEENVSPYMILDQEALESPLGSGGVIFHPFLQGERSPFVNPDARGIFFGFGLWTKKKDFIRAILEGVAFAAKDNIELFQQKNLPIKEVRLTGGGAKSSLWAQILADVLGVKIAVPKVKDSGALGSAIEASIVAGIFNDFSDAVRIMVDIERVYTPDLAKTEKYEKIFRIYRKLYEALWEIYKEASKTFSEL